MNSQGRPPLYMENYLIKICAMDSSVMQRHAVDRKQSVVSVQQLRIEKERRKKKREKKLIKSPKLYIPAISQEFKSVTGVISLHAKG